MSMTKADYDELVRLRDGKYGIKFYFITRDEDESVFAWVSIPYRTQMYGRKNYWITGHDDFEENYSSNLFKNLKWTDEPLNIASAIAEYERAQKPESEMTIHGYSVKHLEMIAVLMRDHGITPDDVKAAARNFSEGAMIAFNIANESIAKNMQDTVSRIVSPYTEGETK